MAALFFLRNAEKQDRYSLVYQLEIYHEIPNINKIGQKWLSIPPIFLARRGLSEPYQAHPRLDREHPSTHRDSRFYGSARLGLCIAKHAGTGNLAYGIAIHRVHGP